MHSKLVALVTGANKGIGLQIAKDLVKHGLTVLVGARDLAAGEAAAKSIGEGAIALQLDVTKQASVKAAAERVRKELGRLDVLVNNAGISHAGSWNEGVSIVDALQTQQASSASLDEIRTVFETNYFGVIAVTQAFLPLLREAPAGRIVNVSSSLGSLAGLSDPKSPYRNMGIVYPPTKTALNALTVAFANELASTKIKVNAACPGYVATDLNRHQGYRTVEQGAKEPVRLALLGPDGPTGGYTNEDGPIPW